MPWMVRSGDLLRESRAFSSDISHEESLPPILTLEEVAAYFDRRPSTIYEWIARGLLDATYRKRGKHLFFWRDRVTKLKLEYEDNKYETQ